MQAELLIRLFTEKLTVVLESPRCKEKQVKVLSTLKQIDPMNLFFKNEGVTQTKMNMEDIIRLNVKDVRAIKSASIVLNGITVVTGVNGCGKSTLSKLLYYIIRDTLNLEELVIKELNANIRPYLNILEIIQSELSYRNIFSQASKTQQSVWHGRIHVASFKEAHILLQYAKELNNLYLENIANEVTPKKSVRLINILRSTLFPKEEASIKAMLDLLINKLSEQVSKAEKRLSERMAVPLKNNINEEFNADISKNIRLTEYGEDIFGTNVKNMPLLHTVSKVAYIDTPMAIGLRNSAYLPSYWNEINHFLEEPPKRGYKRKLNNLIKNNILMGDASYEKDIVGGFKYKRLDGKEFDLAECATGIKSFAILQLLLKNLFLDETSLLIIDEPEAHLHPQWVVEYANLIVLLHKYLGAKFFIASHSTDMVSALRYISEKENTLEALSFYVAKEEEKNIYNFQNIGTDIDPIFKSFNKSYETLERYAK